MSFEERKHIVDVKVSCKSSNKSYDEAQEGRCHSDSIYEEAQSIHVVVPVRLAAAIGQLDKRSAASSQTKNDWHPAGFEEAHVVHRGGRCQEQLNS